MHVNMLQDPATAEKKDVHEEPVRFSFMRADSRICLYVFMHVHGHVFFLQHACMHA